MNLITLIDQPRMTGAEVAAIVDAAHRRKRSVIAHAHRPAETRRGLRAGIDGYEPPGLATTPAAPPHTRAPMPERTADPALGSAAPRSRGFFNDDANVANPPHRADPAWPAGVPLDLVADI